MTNVPRRKILQLGSSLNRQFSHYGRQGHRYVLGGQVVDMAGGSVELVGKSEYVGDTDARVEVGRNGRYSDDEQLKVLAEI